MDRTPVESLNTPTPAPDSTIRRRLILPLLLMGIAWLQELIDAVVFRGRWALPIGQGTAWWSLFTAPFSHSGVGHLLTNTVAFLPLSYLVISQGMRAYVSVWIAVILLEIPIWLFWPSRSHGLSGVVYGLLGYLILLGFIERRLISLMLTMLVLCLYGGALIGLLPWATPAGVSWIGHFSGFVGGSLAAMVLAHGKHDE